MYSESGDDMSDELIEDDASYAEADGSNSNYEPILPHNPYKRKPRDVWSFEETKYMLEKYVEYIQEVGIKPCKRFRKKVDMWEQISIDCRERFGMTITGDQVNNKYKKLLNTKRKRMITDPLRRRDDNYGEEWERIKAVDMSVESYTNNIIIVESPEYRLAAPTNILPNVNKVAEVLRKTLLDVEERREKARARRDARREAREEKKEAKKQKRHEEFIKLLKQL